MDEIILKKIDINKSSNEWNNFIENNINSDNNNYFIAHNPCIGKIFEKSFNYKSEYYIILKNDQLIGLLPGFRIAECFISMPILPMAGIFINNKMDKNECYQIILPVLGKFEIRESDAISKYYYDKKVSCYLNLKYEIENEWKGLTSKLRSQVNKGYKNGIIVKINGEEYLDEFYDIYSTNMHRLGSPVLSKAFFSNLIKYYENGVAKIFIAYYENIPVAGSIVLSYHKLIEVGWASALNEYNRFNPNMVLYWEMIKYSIENRMEHFSFGRASRGSGSHKFKLQWGAIENQLYFNYSEFNYDIRRLKFLAKLWKFMPAEVANKFGPFIRNRLHI